MFQQSAAPATLPTRDTRNDRLLRMRREAEHARQVGLVRDSLCRRPGTGPRSRTRHGR
jgi:hypothetical protein